MSLRETLYPKVAPIAEAIVAFLKAQGISPNQLTLAGAALSLLTGVIYAKGYLFLGGIALFIAGAADLLDGLLARTTGKTSPFGAFFDSVVDRYSDFFVFAGLAVLFVRTGEIFWFLVTLGIILGSVVVSYTKARAENFIKNCGVGIFGRSERVLLLIVGTLVTPLLKLILLVLLVGTHATAIQRILHTKKTLAEPSRS
ncbi:MAG: CDP-alcohol phosphatidyltransferase family protein [Candidatus Omnitrophica bacterium]|nr:CDP-alcohol phosphatidyltransferase family protein [Candidatus Omnitrophota bacterium]